jgi:hypothetical protein
MSRKQNWAEQREFKVQKAKLGRENVQKAILGRAEGVQRLITCWNNTLSKGAHRLAKCSLLRSESASLVK